MTLVFSIDYTSELYGTTQLWCVAFCQLTPHSLLIVGLALVETERAVTNSFHCLVGEF